MVKQLTEDRRLARVGANVQCRRRTFSIHRVRSKGFRGCLRLLVVRWSLTILPGLRGLRTGRRAVAFAHLLLLPAEALIVPTQALARTTEFAFNLPEAAIGVTLSSFSQITGASVGWSGTVPSFRTARVRGRMSAEAALLRLLARSGFTVVRVAPTAFRIEPKPHPIITALPRPVREVTVPRTVATLPPLDIVVTGQKRAQPLRDVPMSVAVVALVGAQDGQLSTATRDLALSVEGLALTNLGSGRNRPFIRGVADSPFNGISQTTVAVQLDEARITFDAPDPDLRLVDFERVEILKGPQGPLYGAGALGGIYHLVTRRPDLAETSGSLRVASETVEHGGLGAGLEAVLNLPLVTDRLGLRGVGYVTREGGWIDNLSGRQNANASRVDGGRLATRWQPDQDWSVDVLGTIQNTNVADSQYVTASDETVIRNARMAEPTDNDFKSAAVTIRGRLGRLRVLAASSYVVCFGVRLGTT